jgi:hypothetical protein
MTVNLETPPQHYPPIPIVILLPHTYSEVLITTRKIHFNGLLLPHTQSTLFIISRRAQNLSPTYLAVSYLLAYAIYQFLPRSFSLLWGFS